jgi:hypothetical protein
LLPLVPASRASVLVGRHASTGMAALALCQVECQSLDASGRRRDAAGRSGTSGASALCAREVRACPEQANGRYK